MPNIGKEPEQYPWEDVASKHLIFAIVGNIFIDQKNAILKGRGKAFSQFRHLRT